GADRADAPDSWGNPFQPAHRFRLSLVLLDRVAAGHEQRIDLSAYLAKGLIRRDAQPAIGHYRSVQTDSHHFDGIDGTRFGVLPGMDFRCTSEGLERSDKIENFDAGPRDEPDATRPRFEWRFIIVKDACRFQLDESDTAD